MAVFFYIMLGIFVLVEAFIAFRFKKRGEAVCIKYTVVPSVLYFMYLLMLCILRISVPYLVLIFALFTIVFHTCVGIYYDLYHKSKIFDRYLHAFGSFSFALLIYLTLSKLTEPGGTVLFRAVFVAALGMAAGALFEIFEFAHDTLNKTKLQRGLKDTDVDLICDAIGSVGAAVLAVLIYL